MDRSFETIDEYIASLPSDVQAVLQQLRKTIRNAAPKAEEGISYRMPVFKLNGVLVWFAAFKDHVGFFPRESAIEAFKDKLSEYDTSKGTIRFPLGKPIPVGLINEIVRFRVKENLSRKQATKKY